LRLASPTSEVLARRISQYFGGSNAQVDFKNMKFDRACS